MKLDGDAFLLEGVVYSSNERGAFFYHKSENHPNFPKHACCFPEFSFREPMQQQRKDSGLIWTLVPTSS